MFEDDQDAKNKINPESINPHSVKRPGEGKKQPEEYEDTPEFRKSLNLKVNYYLKVKIDMR